jgi:hypothetical protein
LDQGRIADRSERDEAYTVRKLIYDSLCYPQGQPSLADPARTCERNEANVMAQQPFAHCLYLSLATDKWGEVQGQAGGLSTISSSAHGWRARRHLEAGTILSGQPQRIGEAVHGIPVRPPVLSALEEADGIHAQPGPLGQVFLRQPCRPPVLAQQISKYQLFTGVRHSLSLAFVLRHARYLEVLPVCAHDSTPKIHVILGSLSELSGRLYDLSVVRSGSSLHDGDQEVKGERA